MYESGGGGELYACFMRSFWSVNVTAVYFTLIKYSRGARGVIIMVLQDKVGRTV